MKYYSISEAAAKFNIPESTIRYYDKRGLLPQIERDSAGRRLFSEDQLEFLEVVLILKNSNMPIRAIKQYVDWVEEGNGTTALRLDMFTNHKQAVLAEISLLQQALPTIDAIIARYTRRARIQERKEARQAQKPNGKEE